jgi:toxin-antitoxin system PIN domain toxin
MSVALLDVNVLLALAWRAHVHHGSANRWFSGVRKSGWATCPMTEAAFVRLSVQPAVVGETVHPAEAIRVLAENCQSADHEFWPQDQSVREIIPEILERLVGHKQIADAVLLDMAIRNGGRLATFDRGIERLLAPDSAHRSAIEVIA